MDYACTERIDQLNDIIGESGACDDDECACHWWAAEAIEELGEIDSVIHEKR